MRAPIIWINGPFGIGKSQTAQALHDRLPGSFLFDPQEMGHALAKLTPGFRGDTQGHPMWIPLMLDALQYASKEADGPIVVPVSVADLGRHRRLTSGLRDRGLDVQHFTLTAPLPVVLDRLSREERAVLPASTVEERLHQLQGEAFRTHINTADLGVQAVAEEIARHAGLDLRPVTPDPLRWLRGAFASRR